MNFLKATFVLSLLIAFACSATFQLSSCTKHVVDHDTVTVRDTTIIKDTIYDLTDGLVAYYNFNGGSLHDSSGNNNDIIFSNASKTSDRFGNPNNAYLFDGSSGYMEVANSASLNPNNGITLMAIVKVNGFYTGSCHDNQILGKLSSDPTDGIYSLRFNDITANCTTSPNTNIELFTGEYGDNNPQGSDASIASDPLTQVETGQWYTVIFTYDGTFVKLYVNGALQGTLHQTVGFTPNNVDLFIGKTPNATFPYYFNGVIDEIRIYNRALSPVAVKQLNLVKE